MAASAFASSQVPWGKYDIFISFRGSDIRSGFLSHLTKELCRKQVDVYVDDRLERGDEISSALEEAIEGSMIALVIFSKDYASSKWCLQELVKIMEHKEANQQIVIPVFFYVDPSDVRHQKGTYADAFILLEHKFKDNLDQLQIWRSVLKKSADLSGYNSSFFRNESQLIDAIVQDVIKKLGDNKPVVPKSQLVGFDQNLTSVESLMKTTSQKIRVLGIWGVGGIGKTTLARATFDKLSSQFESYCFLENVREESTRSNGLSYLRQKLLSKLLDQDEDLPINMNYAMRKLSRKKVLIALDDVSNAKQLKELAGQQLYLGPGSRMIVTSRDKHVFRSGGIRDKYIHEVKELNFGESLKLFSLHAFNQTHPNMGYEKLSEMTVVYAEGIPLALEVLGSHFHSRDKVYWESELSKFQKYPHPEIQNILRVSYDGLDAMDKEIFLDIAFFFVGERKINITWVLEACGFKAVSGIENLIDKALMKINQEGEIEMHDLIQEMVDQIVREESTKHPERRSRLKDVDEIYDILKSNMGTDEIEGIIMDMTQIKHVQLSADIFMKMKNLRFLIFFQSKSQIPKGQMEAYNIELPFGLDFFPHKLRYFYWDQYPLESLPLAFCVENLVELHMEGSNIKKLWDGVQDLGNLKILNLSGSKELMELPDFSMAHDLKEVDLSGCTNLGIVHPSILSLKSLVELDVSFCWQLESLESETHLESLSCLKVKGCWSLKKFCLSSNKLEILDLRWNEVEILHLLPIGGFKVLRKLVIYGERLRSLPISELCGLTNLEKFVIRDFELEIHTKELHSLFDAWPNLRKLHLEGGSSLPEIPNNIKGLTSLKTLSLKRTSVGILPACINHLPSLKFISLYCCKRLKSIHGLPPFLEELDARECTSLEIVFSDSLVRNQCRFDFTNCIKLDECSVRFIEKLTHFSLTSACEDDLLYIPKARYPGSRIPNWIEYKQMTEPSNAIEFICNLKRSPHILFCCVVPPHLDLNVIDICCDFSYENNKFRSTYNGLASVDDDLDLDHVVLWHMKRDSFGAGIGNLAKILCEFYAIYLNYDSGCLEEAPVKACGVHVTFNSESNSDEERLPPIKKQENSEGRFRLIKELNKGKELSRLLRDQIASSSSSSYKRITGVLVEKILYYYENTSKILVQKNQGILLRSFH